MGSFSRGSVCRFGSEFTLVPVQSLWPCALRGAARSFSVDAHTPDKLLVPQEPAGPSSGGHEPRLGVGRSSCEAEESEAMNLVTVAWRRTKPARSLGSLGGAFLLLGSEGSLVWKGESLRGRRTRQQ